MTSYEYEYEFKKGEEKIINDLSKAMRFVALFLNVLGWLLVFGGLLQERLDKDDFYTFEFIITGIAILLVALWTNNAAKCFKKIPKAQGSDIKNLMDAFNEIRNLYRFKLWLWFIMPIIYIVLIFIYI